MAAKNKGSNAASVFSKTDLVEHLLKQHKDMTKTHARAVVNDVLEGMKQGIRKNDRVSIAGFGSYTKTTLRKEKGGKKMYMPALGREIVTKPKPTRYKIKFNPAQDLRLK